MEWRVFLSLLLSSHICDIWHELLSLIYVRRRLLSPGLNATLDVVTRSSSVLVLYNSYASFFASRMRNGILSFDRLFLRKHRLGIRKNALICSHFRGFIFSPLFTARYLRPWLIPKLFPPFCGLFLTFWGLKAGFSLPSKLVRLFLPGKKCNFWGAWRARKGWRTPACRDRLDETDRVRWFWNEDTFPPGPPISRNFSPYFPASLFFNFTAQFIRVSLLDFLPFFSNMFTHSVIARFEVAKRRK